MIKELTLVQTIKKLHDVPEEKKRLIMTVGHHPNERTHEIAALNEEYWTNNLPLTIVQWPDELTPQHVWNKLEAEMEGEFKQLTKIFPNYEQIEQEMYKDAIYVRLHCTPGNVKYSLQFYINKKEPNPKLWRCVENRKEDLFLEPGGLLIEYSYHGLPVPDPSSFVLEAIKKFRFTPLSIGQFPIDWSIEDRVGWGQVSPKYLKQNRLSDQEIHIFQERYSLIVRTTLEKLSEN